MDILKTLTRLTKENKAHTVATVVDTDGSSPASIGQKMVILPEGETIGTVGGGAIEQKAIKDGLEMLKKRISGTKSYNLVPANNEHNDSQEDVGMLCGGKATVYYETVVPRYELYIFGGGHISQALGKLVDKEKFKLIIVDNREKFANSSLHTNADKTVHSNYAKFTASFDPAPNSFAVIVTHAHTNDYEVLHNLYKRKLPFQYIGMIGSRDKVSVNISHLYKELGKISLDNLYSPIGLKIGGDSPHEIAISIIGEIQSVIFNKKIKHMKMDYEKI